MKKKKQLKKLMQPSKGTIRFYELVVDLDNNIIQNIARVYKQTTWTSFCFVRAPSCDIRQLRHCHADCSPCYRPTLDRGSCHIFEILPFNVKAAPLLAMFSRFVSSLSPGVLLLLSKSKKKIYLKYVKYVLCEFPLRITP